MGTSRHVAAHTHKKIDRLNIRISGSGGQGVISCGMLLGAAIALGDGRTVSQSQSYGPEARGGAACADIIVSDGEIYFPECTEQDILVAFTAEAYEKYAVRTRAGGTVFADDGAVDVLAGSGQTVKVPFLERARQKFERTIVANIIALGFLATRTGVVSPQALREAVAEEYEGSAHRELNLQALEEGFRMGSETAT